MRKNLVGVLCAAAMLGSLSMTAYASPQKPCDWRGYAGSNRFDWNENTTVEMKNGDGTDVVTVNGEYIYNNSINNAFPYVWEPRLQADLPCQVVKEDAYIIMPFDGYVSIGIVNLSGMSSDNYFVRAKAGDKVNMVPQNLVAVYDVSNPEREYQYHSELVNTTADDWTYTLMIYKETFVHLIGRTDKWGVKNITENPSVSVPMNYDDSDASLMYLYQVDAPNTTLKAKEIDWNGAYEDYNNCTNGWREILATTGVSGSYEYVRNGHGWAFRMSGGIEIEYEDYDSGLIELKGDELYVDGYKINTATRGRIDPQYNIVNAQ